MKKSHAIIIYACLSRFYITYGNIECFGHCYWLLNVKFDSKYLSVKKCHLNKIDSFFVINEYLCLKMNQIE
jgi:hypothetical protein